MSRLVEVDFRIRAQPASERVSEPLEPQWVKLRMDKPTYDRFASLRDELMPDGREGGMIADVARRKVLLEEMHQLAELVYFLDAAVVGEEQIDVDARTDLLATVERLEAEHGFKIPERLKGAFAVGQLRIDAPGATRLEAVESGPGPDPTDQDRQVTDPVRTSPLDAAAGAQAREEAIRRVTDAAPGDWRLRATQALLTLVRQPGRASVTTDDVWELLSLQGVEPPPERRAMAAVVRHGESSGWIEKTDRFVQSKLPWAHRRNTQVWLVKGVSAKEAAG